MLLVTSFANIPNEETRSNIGYWFGVHNNTSMDAQTMNKIGGRSNLVVLHNYSGGIHDELTLSQVMSNMRKANPVVKLLAPSRGSMFQTPSSSSATYAYPGSTIIKTMSEHQEWMLQYTGPAPGQTINQLGMLPDPSNSAFRDYFTTAWRDEINQNGWDGLHLDMAFHSPNYFLRSKSNDTQFVARYQNGMQQLFKELRQKLGSDKIITYNGLWNVEGIDMADQEKLLSDVSGATIEFFGADPVHASHTNNFDGDIKAYLDLPAKHPNKLIWFHGRPTTLGYQNYAEVHQRQRFTYAAYLMARAENTKYSFVGNWALDVSGYTAMPTRVGGAEVYDDWDIALGSPNEPYKVKDTGIYERSFQKGLVLMNPDNSTPQQYQLPHSGYTTEGVARSGTITINPGEGVLLFNEKPDTNRTVKHDFEEDAKLFSDLKNATVMEGGGNHYLALTPLSKWRPEMHDIRLDSINRASQPKQLSFNIRTTDPSAKVTIMADIDDSTKSNTLMGITVSSEGADKTPYKDKFKIYKSWVGGTVITDYLPATSSFKADGSWQTVNVSAIYLLTYQSSDGRCCALQEHST